MPDKQRSTVTYAKMVQMVKGVMPTPNPTSVICDFEQAAVTAMKEGFLPIEVK